jgi:hypothetical protein
LGAVTAEALAERAAVPVSTARAKLVAGVRERLLVHQRPLADRPALYTLTATGRRLAGLPGLDHCRVTPSNALHLIECAGVAAALERGYPDHRVGGERELRLAEREHGGELASARIGTGAAGEALLHRPDLVLWPLVPERGLPVAVEVELTVKAPRRLADICRAWARCRCVSGVVYLASPEVEQPLARAIARADAAERVLVVPLAALAPADAHAAS